MLILGLNRSKANDIASRLSRAGADLSRIFFADAVYLPVDTLDRWKRQISLADSLASVRRTIRELAPLRLVVLDPLWVFTGTRGQAQAGCVAQVADMAADTGAAVVGVTDLVRDLRGRGALRVKGERTLAEAAHSVWGIVPHSEDDELRVLLPLKSEAPLAGPASSGSMAGQVATAGSEMGTCGLEFLICAGQIEWDSQPSQQTVESVLAAERYGGELEMAKEWLLAILTKDSLRAERVFELARESRIAMRTLRRAKVSLGVRAKQAGFPDDPHWVWSLGRAQRCEINKPR